jgi:hypothetical protein
VGILKTYQHLCHAELKRVLSLNIFPILDTTFQRDHTSPSTMHGSMFFKSQKMKKDRLVIRGKYGLSLAQAYLAHFSKVPGIEASNGLFLMVECVNALIKRIEAV